MNLLEFFSQCLLGNFFVSIFDDDTSYNFDLECFDNGDFSITCLPDDKPSKDYLNSFKLEFYLIIEKPFEFDTQPFILIYKDINKFLKDKKEI